jgi:D-alanyl-D-alanine carboxypeptidase
MSRQSTAAQLVTESIGSRRGGVHAFRRTASGEEDIRSGRRDAAGGALGPDDAFRVGSISKLVVATLVLTLRDAGGPLIDLDEPLAAYLGNDSVGARATIRALLSHRSGLPGYTDHPEFEETTLVDRDRWWTPREVLDTFVDPSPGEALAPVASYSNTNYLLLGLAVEAVTGRPLHEVIRDELAVRLGLSRTMLPHAGWDRPDWLVPAWSPGTLRGNPDDQYTSFESAAWAAGAVISSVADLATLIDALFDDAFLDPVRRREMMTPAVGDFGFGLRTMQVGPREWVGHLGVIRGYMSAIRLDRRSTDRVVVLTNDDLINVDVLANQLASGATSTPRAQGVGGT